MKLFRSKLFKAIFILVNIMVIYNLSLSVYDLWQRRDIIVEKERELAQVEKKNLKLKREIEKSFSSEFIEQQARDKLSMSKPEDMVIMLDKLGTQAGSMDNLQQNQDQYQGPKWKLWWRLFF